MVERKLTGPKRKNGKNPKQDKPSRYVDMVLAALQSLKDPKGSNPKSIVGYIANSYNVAANKTSLSSSVYRALKRALNDDLLLRNSYGNFNLSAKGKRQRKAPAKRGKKRRKAKRKKKRRKQKRRKKKTRRRKRSRRKRSRKKSPKKHRKRRFYEEDLEEPRKRRRKKTPSYHE